MKKLESRDHEIHLGKVLYGVSKSLGRLCEEFFHLLAPMATTTVITSYGYVIGYQTDTNSKPTTVLVFLMPFAAKLLVLQKSNQNQKANINSSLK